MIQETAQAIATEISKEQIEHHIAFDPLLILTIIYIITDVIRIYMGCKKTSKEACDAMNHASTFEKWRLKKIIKQHIDDEDMYKYVGDKIVNGTIKVAKALTEKEIEVMYKEIT